ncbi:MAG TPA: 30S ribosomal protein S20 [Opitutales bacterium]|nr:30S ribosomal protein S20 [Opitutales bacterium]
MANIKSSQKDIRRTKARTARNIVVVSRIKTLRKKVVGAAETGEATSIATATGEYASALDKAAKRGIIHANKANRVKSRMAKLAKKSAAPAASEAPAAQ